MWMKKDLFSQFKRALECMKEQDLTGAKGLLMEVKEESENNREWPEGEGEWNLLMAMCHYLEPDRAIPLLEKARTLIHGRSEVVPPCTSMKRDMYSPIYWYLQTPGTADETGRKLEHMMELYDSLCGGIRHDQLYQAQLAFYRGELERAESFLLKNEGNAKKSGNGLSLVCSAEYRIRIAIQRQSLSEWSRIYDQICRFQDSESRVVRETAACLKTRVRMAVGLIAEVPKWIQDGTFGAVSDGGRYRIVDNSISHEVFPLAWSAHMEYLLFSGQYSLAVNAADMASTLYGLDWMPLYDAYLWLYRASAWKALGDRKKEQECLKQSMDILVPDGLWMFAGEFLPMLGEDLMQAMERFGEETADQFRDTHRGYIGKLSEIRKFTSETVFRESLTEKEQAVAKLAAIGLKNEEVGEYLSISPNTVKYHLANVYKKLGIKNRIELKNAMEDHREGGLAVWVQTAEKEKY